MLRRVDQFRQWRSLDDKRYCLVCGKIITGREIQLTGGARGNGALRVNCPTERCNSIPMDWVLPTDEIIARLEHMAAEERKASTVPPPARVDRVPPRVQQAHNTMTKRLRSFASRFKRHL